MSFTPDASLNYARARAWRDVMVALDRLEQDGDQLDLLLAANSALNRIDLRRTPWAGMPGLRDMYRMVMRCLALLSRDVARVKR